MSANFTLEPGQRFAVLEGQLVKVHQRGLFRRWVVIDTGARVDIPTFQRLLQLMEHLQPVARFNLMIALEKKEGERLQALLQRKKVEAIWHVQLEQMQERYHLESSKPKTLYEWVVNRLRSFPGNSLSILRDFFPQLSEEVIGDTLVTAMEPANRENSKEIVRLIFEQHTPLNEEIEAYPGGVEKIVSYFYQMVGGEVPQNWLKPPKQDSLEEILNNLVDNASPYRLRKLTDQEILKPLQQKCIQAYRKYRRDVSSPWSENFQRMRTQVSKTLTRSKPGDENHTGWLNCDREVKEWALSKTSLTLERIDRINELLAGGQVFSGKAAGRVRRSYELRAGKANNRFYLSFYFVAKEMECFVNWLSEKIAACDSETANPIEIAARAQQKFVSIHPYIDGNGRTSRMIRDYVLQRFSLPPALFFEDASVGRNAAVFLKCKEASSTPEKIVGFVLEGVEKSVQFLRR